MIGPGYPRVEESGPGFTRRSCTAAQRRRKELAMPAGKSRKPPWTRPKPKGSSHTTLTEASKKKAAARAKRAGRTYPNLVDNMRAAAEQKRSRGR